MPDSPAPRPADRAPRLASYVALLLLATLPLAALAFFAYRVATDTVEELVDAGNCLTVELASELVQREFDHGVRALEGFARLPNVQEAVLAHDEEGLRLRLQPLAESLPSIERIFVTDPRGLLWSDFPKAPESLGLYFSHRDWFQGLSREWRPYVSRVYQRNARPQYLIVAIAVPMRAAPDGPVLAALVGQVRLEWLSALLRRAEVGAGGYAFLLDHGGTVVSHPKLDLQAREYDDYAREPLLQASAGDEPRRGEYLDLLTGERVIATARSFDVAGNRWTVVAQQPVAATYGAATLLGWQIAGAGLVLALAVGALGLALARGHTRMRRLNEELAAANRALARENEERLRAERALQQAHDQLEVRVEQRTRELRRTEDQLLHAQKMEAVGRLAGGIAHDFNNMLSVILGYGELAALKLPPDAKLRTALDEIRRAGERAATLTRQLLAFSRKQVLQPEVLDLNEVVAGMERMLRRVIGEDLDLVTAFHADDCRVECDRGQLEQVIVNLVVNARDAMPQGGKLTLETGRLEIDEEYVRTHTDARLGPHVMLAVTDTGIGMDAATQERIFEPFFTTKERGRGTGLGLSTVFGIVKQSGGNIWVYSEPGRGSTFKVYLPCTCATPAPARPAAPVATGGTETVLVVEDEPGVRALIEEVLRGAGYTVLAAADADIAHEFSRGHAGTIHLLLTDVVLPGVGGPKLAAELTAARPDLRVLYMSGYTDNAIVHHGVLDPGIAFLEKPLRPAALLAKVRAVLGGPGGG